MNKRGSVEVIFLVVAVIFLVVSSGIIMYKSSGRVQTKITDARFLREMYSQQNVAEAYIEKIGGDVFARTGKTDFEKKFQEEFASYNFEENYLKELSGLVEKGDFEIKEESDFLEIVVEKLRFSAVKNDVRVVSYEPKISVRVNGKV